MKQLEWSLAKEKLIRIYKSAGITRCEGRLFNENCWVINGLDFHHLDKRSSGRAKNTLKGTRLLCPDCHNKADNETGFTEFNEELRRLR